MSNNNLKTWPEKIWLQVHDEGKTLPAYSLKEGYGDEITWCGDSVWSCEVKYIRADLVPELHTENINLQATNEKLGDDVHMLKEENENLRNFIETNNGSAIALKKTALQALQENEELKKQLRVARVEERERCKQRLSNIDAAKGSDIQIAIKDCIEAIQSLGDTE